ncbi:MAG: AI-2E family transporter [Luteimonas sp.]
MSATSPPIPDSAGTPAPEDNLLLPVLDETPLPPSTPLETRPRATLPATVLAVLAVLFTLWAAQDLVLPVLLSMFLALIGNPIIRLLQRAFVPRFIGALLVLTVGIAGTVLLGRQLIDPASEWVRQVPREMRDLTPKLRNLTKPMQDANKAAENIARAAGGESTARPTQVIRTEVNDPYKALTTTPRMLASVLAVVLLTFFFMVYGENLQRNAIALLPTRQRKKMTVDILQSIEREISRYVLTISIINTLLGLTLAAILLWWVKLPMQEALLWGTVAAVLNFAPYVGPLIGVMLMVLMGFVFYDDVLQSLTPAAIYLGLHTLEGQFITPIVLGRRMRLSPLILILALMVFGWLWGIIGLLLAVPLLVCVKLVLAKIDGLEGWARLLE